MSQKNVSVKKLSPPAIVDGLIVAAILVIAVILRLPIIFARETLLPGDEVMFGLMAKHILHGQFPIYYWGQSYLGVLEAYVTAVLSLIFGMNGITIQLGGFFFYQLFLAINYFLIKRVLGFGSAIFTSIILLVAPTMMMEESVRALGGYSEILFFGALGFWLWLKVFEDGKRGIYPAALGLTLGIALWVNSLFICYLAALGLMTFFWQQNGKLNPVRVLLLQDAKLPIWLKIPFYAIHVFILFYVLQQIGMFFHGTGKPAFQWKTVKLMLWLISGEAVLLAFLVLGWRKLLEWARDWSGLIAGFVIGYLPAIWYNLFGHGGYRILHKSGMIPVSQLAGKFQMLFLSLIPKTLWGGKYYIIALFVAGLIYFAWIHRNGIRKASVFFCFLGAVVLVITFVSSLFADRYLTPFYWVSAVAAGTLLAAAMKKTKGAGALLIIPFLFFNIQAHQAYLKHFQYEDIYGLVRFLEEKGLKGGIFDYDNSYRVNFYSDEKQIFIPLVGMMRRPAYREFVSGLKRRALIFPADSTNEKEYLAAHPAFKPLETHTFKTYRVFVVDENFPIPG
ncbi:MAG: hypothetical protein HZC17_01205 [Candidatus Omnitrophica bacterium]|nr:hypothetical protein [Candidatus Omnitrophota bacterium]